jgi:hypothetical protein
MKNFKTFLAALVLVGSVAGSGMALADDGVISKDVLAPQSYCHEKFPAMQGRSLGTDDPTLKSTASGDIIDFYGPCNENPTGKDQVQEQKLEQEHRMFEE